MNYPLLITTEFFGGCCEIILGLFFLYNLKVFDPSPAEFAILILICAYGVISGIIRISPYIDEVGNELINRVSFRIRGYLCKKK